MLCQYNETLSRPLLYDDPAAAHKLPSTCKNEATVICGKTNSRKEKNRWFLCAACAELPIFKRLRSREPLESGSITVEGSMTLNEYQQKAMASAIYPRKHAIVYPALKLAGEAGEVAEKVGKVLRDNEGQFDPIRVMDLAKEIGDVLWYCAALAEDLDLGLDHIAQLNIEKLSSRKERGVLQGSGDNR